MVQLLHAIYPCDNTNEAGRSSIFFFLNLREARFSQKDLSLNRTNTLQ